MRPGDNLYTASRLALDPKSGEIVWHYQTTPNDGWDYDSISEFIPFEGARVFPQKETPAYAVTVRLFRSSQELIEKECRSFEARHNCQLAL